MNARRLFLIASLGVITFALQSTSQKPSKSSDKKEVITGKAAFADYTQQKPGVRRKITLADLSTQSSDLPRMPSNTSPRTTARIPIEPISKTVSPSSRAAVIFGPAPVRDDPAAVQPTPA